MTAILTWMGIVLAAIGQAEGTAWWDAQVAASYSGLA